MTLHDLQTRLSAATGPDRELDLALVHYLFPKGNCFAPEGDCLDWKDLHEAEPTASLDDALTLVERKLPGKWSIILHQAMLRLGEQHAWHMRRCDQSPAIIAPAILRALVAALASVKSTPED